MFNAHLVWLLLCKKSGFLVLLQLNALPLALLLTSKIAGDVTKNGVVTTPRPAGFAGLLVVRLIALKTTTL